MAESAACARIPLLLESNPGKTDCDGYLFLCNSDVLVRLDRHSDPASPTITGIYEVSAFVHS